MNPKKTILLVLVSSIFFCFSSPSSANETPIAAENHASKTQTLSATPKGASYGQKIGQKALWGLSNSTLGFFEIPKNIIKVSNDTNLIYGLTGGLGLGILQAGGRTLVGVLDLTLFLLPTKPIVQPIHPWQNYLTVETAYGDMFATDF